MTTSTNSNFNLNLSDDVLERACARFQGEREPAREQLPPVRISKPVVVGTEVKFYRYVVRVGYRLQQEFEGADIDDACYQYLEQASALTRSQIEALLKALDRYSQFRGVQRQVIPQMQARLKAYYQNRHPGEIVDYTARVQQRPSINPNHPHKVHVVDFRTIWYADVMPGHYLLDPYAYGTGIVRGVVTKKCGAYYEAEFSGGSWANEYESDYQPAGIIETQTQQLLQVQCWHPMQQFKGALVDVSVKEKDSEETYIARCVLVHPADVRSF